MLLIRNAPYHNRRFANSSPHNAWNESQGRSKKSSASSDRNLHQMDEKTKRHGRCDRWNSASVKIRYDMIGDMIGKVWPRVSLFETSYVSHYYPKPDLIPLYHT